jgi:guanosine-3',5'-bis(diphosphate) 3'-pyrophosphohydrolase
MTSRDRAFEQLLHALAFAARAHRHQLRKDGQTPYVSHVFRVCLTVRQLFGVDDPRVLAAAVLHDTIEDTTTDFDDLIQVFGADVASWVRSLTKDKRLPEDERERTYMAELSEAPWQVQVCKLADVHDNLHDSACLPPEKRSRTLARSREYLEALHTNLKREAQEPFRIVDQVLSGLEKAARTK